MNKLATICLFISLTVPAMAETFEDFYARCGEPDLIRARAAYDVAVTVPSAVECSATERRDSHFEWPTPTQRIEVVECVDISAQLAEEAAQAAYPAPEVVVPCVDDNGVVIPELTARLVVRASTWTLLAPTNSASPQKAWSNQQGQIRWLISREDERAAKKSSGKAKNESANNVPQLREAVAELFEALP